MAGRLVVIKGYDRDKSLELNTASTYCIGRGGTGKSVDFKVDPCEYLTSRQHFFIDYLPPRFFVRDNSSTNGTLIQRGDAAIPVTAESTEVFEGDRIVAGNTVFVLVVTDDAYEIPFVKAKEPEKEPEALAQSLVNPDGRSLEAVINESAPPQEAKPASTVLVIGDPTVCGESSAFSAPKPLDQAEPSPDEKQSSAAQDYYSVVVPEIQLFHSAQVRCMTCGAPITVEITASELQAYGYPLFMCRKCSAEFKNVPGLKGLDSYLILKQLREDKMGLVYLASHAQTGILAEIRVILLRLVGEDILYLKREIALMQTVSHPNLVRLYEAIVHRDRVCLIYEYMPEGNLESYLKAVSGRLSWNDACRVVCDVLAGLRQCHEMGIVHGDIKPESILFKKDTRGNPFAKLSELGLAWLRNDLGLGFVSGTDESQNFKAPELAQTRTPSPQADVYATGVLFYGLLTGSLPFSPEPGKQSSLNAPPDNHLPISQRNPEIPQALSHIVEKALRHKPEERWQNAAQMLQAILEMRF